MTLKYLAQRSTRNCAPQGAISSFFDQPAPYDFIQTHFEAQKGLEACQPHLQVDVCAGQEVKTQGSGSRQA